MKVTKITIINKFIVGSEIFFNDFNDFTPKDIDYLCILSHPLNKNKSFLINNNGKDYILYPQLTKQLFIEEDLKSNSQIKLGKYLCKEFAQYIDLTVKDLKKLKPLYNKLDDKHLYQKVIYDSYLTNNKFELTDELRLLAYEEYKKYR